MTTATHKVLVVGIDGVRYDTLVATRTPRLDGLTESGFRAPSVLYPRQPEPTVSGPGWSSVASGTWPDKHLVRDNTLAGNDLANYPSFLTRATQAGQRTFAGLGWAPLDRIFGEQVTTRLVCDADVVGHAEADRRVLPDARRRLGEDDLGAAFVYIGAVDECGHEIGTGPEYVSTLERADEQVGLLLDAVARRPAYESEDWLVIVVTDHGHADGGGHGEQSEAERTAWVIASGPSVVKRPGTVGVVDVAPTVLAHLGVRIDQAWNLDGAPFLARREV